MTDTPFRAWRKKHTPTILKLSAALFALCYILTHWAGTTANPPFMATALAVLILACLLPAAL